MGSPTGEPRLHIGVLALQGAFEEHQVVLEGLGARTTQVKQPHELEGLDGLVLPGGESTAMALAGEQWGIFPAVKEAVEGGLPVLGTCAGMVLLADRVDGQMNGGQALVGGLNIDVCRNYFGSQVDSFELDLVAELESSKTFPAVFIRAPAATEVGDDVQVLASVTAKRASKNAKIWNEGDQQEEAKNVAVAVRKNHIIATAFHPELSDDTSWHRMLLHLARKYQDRNVNA